MLEAAVGIIGTAVLGIAAWAVQLHSRVSVLETDRVSLKELLDLKLVDILRRLERIEVKLDHKDREEQ